MALGASNAARFQAYQTRARMGAQLWSRVVLWTLIGWFALTMYVVWRQTGVFFPQLGHQYFWRWIICGIITSAPLLNRFAPILEVPVDGAWYPIPEMTDWLSGPELYHAQSTAWLWHYGIRTALIPIGIGVLAVAWRYRHAVDAEHLRGLQLLSPRQHNRQLNGGVLSRFYRSRPLGGLNGRVAAGGIRMGSSVIPAEKENEHFLITGSPGAGKSVLIRTMLDQIQERGQTAIVLDVESDFVQEFYDPKRGDVVLNPLDRRCPFWSPWLEFRDESASMDAEAMAASLIRGQARNATEQFFRDSARSLIEAIFQVVHQRDSAKGILEFLSLPRGELHEALKNTLAYPLVDPKASEQGTGIISVAANATKAFHHLPRRDEAADVWCARDWAEQRRGWVFLPSDESARAAVQSLQGVWLDALTRWLMAAEIGSEQVWIIADELPAMGYQNQIEQLITRGRKRGLSLVIGFQNISQLRSIYGRDAAITLSSSPTTKVILRSDESETAKWASDLLGSREIERLNMTQLAGLSTYREGVNLAPQRTTEHIVTPAEIQLLKPLHGYLCVAGHDRTSLKIPPRYLERHHPAFIRRGTVGTRNEEKGIAYDAC